VIEKFHECSTNSSSLSEQIYEANILIINRLWSEYLTELKSYQVNLHSNMEQLVILVHDDSISHSINLNSLQVSMWGNNINFGVEGKVF
jgi:hypothetical protein